MLGRQFNGRWLKGGHHNCFRAFAGLRSDVVCVILEGGTPLALVNIPAFVIVMGGTVGATFISFPMERVKTLPKLFMQTFKGETIDILGRVEYFASLADKARREGLLSLEEDAEGAEDPFLRKGLRLVVDGVDPEMVRNLLETDFDLGARQESDAASIMDAMGGYCPTMGIIGTVMGLVNVLSQLADPSHLGEAIATAFIATLYGVAFANLIFLPMASKLKKNSEKRLLLREVMVEGILAVQAGENPRIVQQRVGTFVVPTSLGKELEVEGGAGRAELARGGT